MAVLKCKMCGGNIEISGDARVIECEYCGTNQTIPDGSDEKKVNLFNRANRLRMDCEFDKAAGVYESIVSEYPEESEGYWGLVLCRFGIEYVDDAATGKKIPTCHRTNTTSIMDDADFEQVLENSDVIAKGTYREEAKAIDRLQRKIISVAESEEPYDVFICYKETDDITKQRTEDSSIAQDIYTELVREGYKVFFSRITLRDKAGTEYEPYIYAALSSAKVMLAIGTKYDYYDAVWVKNEWGRFISMMKNDNTKHLIPCFKNLDAYDIPKEFKNLQALDMGEMMFFKNLIENVERFVGNTKIETVVETVVSGSSGALTKRGYLFLEDKDFKSAAEYFERALDENPEDAKAYFGKVLVELRLSSAEEIDGVIVNLDTFKDFDKALRFAVGQDKVYFEKIKENADKRRQIPFIISCLKGYIRKDEKYNEAKQKMETAETCHDYIKARAIFLLIGDYKDSADAAEQCREKCEELKKAEAERIAEEARKAEEERRKAEEAKENEKCYKQGVSLLEAGDLASLKKAASLFEGIIGYKDSETKLKLSVEKLDEIEEKRIISYFQKWDEMISAVEIRESAKPKISKPQSRLEKMAQNNIVEIINDGNVTKYCLSGYGNRKRIREIESEIKKLEVANKEKIQEEVEIEAIRDKIEKLTERKNALSIFSIKEKKQIQSEIYVLMEAVSKLENEIKLRRAEIDIVSHRRISNLTEERKRIENSQK